MYDIRHIVISEYMKLAMIIVQEIIALQVIRILRIGTLTIISAVTE